MIAKTFTSFSGGKAFVIMLVLGGLGSFKHAADAGPAGPRAG